MTTIDEIYAGINPLPAMLSAKGKVNPDVQCMIAANAALTVYMSWKRPGGHNWETDCECFRGDFAEAVAEATAFINELPSAEVSKLRDFMGQLGRLIDAGKESGIDLDYMNPLLVTMKRLSENVITYKPQRVGA